MRMHARHMFNVFAWPFKQVIHQFKQHIMATTFKICVHNNRQRADGLWQVYIRVTHKRQVGYLKTDKVVSRNGLDRNMEVIDPWVVRSCNQKIIDYATALNKVNTEVMSVKDVIATIKDIGVVELFSTYARAHVAHLINSGQERTSRNYKLALEHLERFCGTTKVTFAQLTSHVLNAWIASMEKTHRAKEMYPICMRQVWRKAMKELNDDEMGIVRITNPWPKVDIPKADKTEKLAITPTQCRNFFACPAPENKMKMPVAQLGKDVAMMVLCLGGINTVDLYKLQKADYHDGIIHYKRSKTAKFRADEAYMEMRVPEILEPVFKRYLADKDDPYLFWWHKVYSSSDTFGNASLMGIHHMCNALGMPKKDWYCVYTFRHTWGTIAQNECGASISEVAFGMNHASGHTVTRGYLKLNFEPAWELNEKVVDLVFNSTQDNGRAQEKEPQLFRLSKNNMVRGTAMLHGKTLAMVEDIGYTTKLQVVQDLQMMLPEDMPPRTMVTYVIENLDSHMTATFERRT